MNGDGDSSGEIPIDDKTGPDCINACKQRMKTDPTINGVTTLINGQDGCWCEKKMTSTVEKIIYKTCILEG